MNKAKWAIITLILLLIFIPISVVMADTQYTVQPGDSLSKIARTYDITVEDIVAANDIDDPAMISVGMTLILPTDALPAAEPIQSPSSLNKSMIESSQHVVQIGESLSKIGVQFDLDYRSLAWFNAIEAPYILQIGQVLKVPNPMAMAALSSTILRQAAAESAMDTTPTKADPAAGQTEGVHVYETSVTIPTYDYEAAFLPTTEDDSIYPYPRIDHDKEVDKTSQTYKAVVLENDYVSVMILPELGGRVYSWQDKTTGRELLYQNPVINPTNWGYRGWWLAAGGIEWAFPVEEHGLNEWRPWSYSVGSDSVTVSDVDDRTGMEVGATISLSADDAVMTLEPWASNDTADAQQYQLWLNAMLALNDNTVSEQTEFILPTQEVIVHSTGDESLPGPEGPMDWPQHDDRDMSFYGNWSDYLGFFVPIDIGFSGVYDHSNDQGMVRAIALGKPAGTKIFGPGSLPSYLWTDDSSDYVEMWSGATDTFWDYTTLEPGQTVSWSEYWYPVQGMGGYNFANRVAALRLNDSASGAEIGLAVSEPVSGELTLWAGKEAVASWPVDMVPGQALQASWSRLSGQEGPLELRLEDSSGEILAQMEQVP